LGALAPLAAGCDDLRLKPIPPPQVDSFAQAGQAVTEEFVQDGQAKVDAFQQSGFTQVDAFQQKAAAEVDILWVVDNSASMVEEQNNLANNFQSFIGYIDQSLIDYHIGVVAMDMFDPAHAGKLVGTTRVITRTTPNAGTVFAANIRVGTAGGGFEQGILAAHDALSEPLVSGHNAGFLREGASLAVIFVSDEDDSSQGDIRYYQRFFTTLKQVGNERRVIMAAIVGEGPSGCSGGSGQAAYGERYHQFIEALGGTTASICAADFSVTLAQLGLTVAGLGRKFSLSQEPDPVTLEVRVRESGSAAWSDIPRDDADGWRYDGNENAIYFDGSYVPPPEADIEVEYGNSQYAFQLSGRGDPGTLAVTVDPDGDGPLQAEEQEEGVDFVFDAVTNTVVFLEGHVPPLGSTIEVSYAALRREFRLGSQVDNPQTLRVMVDMDPTDPVGFQEVLRDPASGFIYNAGTNAVLFQGAFIPPLGAAIQVRYSNLRWLFPLTKEPVLNTLVVVLDLDGDGPALPMPISPDNPGGEPGYVYYDLTQPAPYTNSLSFEKLDWPPLGSVVRATYQPVGGGQ
jgi:hypothetical protein